MALFVVDANVALSWVLPDEPLPDGPERLRQEVRRGEASCAAPSVWEYEVSNVISRGIRSGRVEHDEGLRAWLALRQIPVKIHELAPIIDRTWQLALGYGLTFYDASYLALAEQLGCECVTADGGMVRAAASTGLVRWIGDYE